MIESLDLNETLRHLHLIRARYIGLQAEPDKCRFSISQCEHSRFFECAYCEQKSGVKCEHGDFRMQAATAMV
jgi:hypothetical protein